MGPDITYFCFFWARIWENCCNIWNQHPRIFLIAKLRKRKSLGLLDLKSLKKIKKCLNFRPKRPYLGLPRLLSEKIYSQIWDQHQGICQIAKTCGKTKHIKFLDKKTLFAHLRARIFQKLLWCLKSTVSNLSICKILQKTPKISKLGTKNDLFWF